VRKPFDSFFDEIDGLLPRNNGMLNTHDTQLVSSAVPNQPASAGT